MFSELSTESQTSKQLILAEPFHIYRINCSSGSDVCIYMILRIILRNV